MSSASWEVDYADGAYSTEELLPLVYSELRLLAANRLRKLNSGETLQATALVHEVYLKLLGPGVRQSLWVNPAHFFSAASEAMRQIVIDVYRRKQAVKRGGGQIKRSLADLDQLPQQSPDIDLLQINEAIGALELIDPDKATVVKLKYFFGMTMNEVGAALGISLPTAERHWRYSKAFLARHLKDYSA